MRKIRPYDILNTELGEKWLLQFDFKDRDHAEKLVSNLTLISHSEFQRSIQKLLEIEASKHKGSIAFYAPREISVIESYFNQASDQQSGKINALSQGSDHGSEAIITNLIRSFCKTDPSILLNHPNIAELRSKKCRTIVLVDDLIGSGGRITEFLQSMWQDKTIRSWHSYHLIKFIVIAYSATERGIGRVEKHKTSPIIVIERLCPSFKQMPWKKSSIEGLIDFCTKYGRKTCKKNYPLGHDSTMSSMVFEHGCPNNAPVILWAHHTDKAPWCPLFPSRSVLFNEKSVFPTKVAKPASDEVLLNVGQKRLAKSSTSSMHKWDEKNVLLLLALIAKGQRTYSKLGYATGLNQDECAEMIEKCIKWGFITQLRRLTDLGKAELNSARKNNKLIKLALPDIGEEYYYPKQLRSTAHG